MVKLSDVDKFLLVLKGADIIDQHFHPIPKLQPRIMGTLAPLPPSRFTDLIDVPNSYLGQSGKIIKVKATENGLEFALADWPKIQVSTAFGTVGLDNPLGSGYLATNLEFAFQVQTGETVNSTFYRSMGTFFIKLNEKIDIDTGIDTEFMNTDAFVQTSFVLSSISYAPPDTYDQTGDFVFAGFWLVCDATYNKRILAVTRDLTGSEITDCGPFEIGEFHLLKIENREGYVKYYVDGVLVATHTTHLPWSAGFPSNCRLGISSQTEGYDQGILFYFFNFTVWP